MKKEILQTIHARLDKIETLVRCAAKNVLTAQEVSDNYGIPRSTLDKLTSQNKIPHFKNAEGGKFNYYDKQEVEAFLKGIRVPTTAELQSQAEAYHYKKRGKYHV